MRIMVTGSIATDHLMTFPGRFTDALLPERLESLSVSFLADDLQIRRGGVAPNICFGLGVLGLNPVLVGAAGADFADYRAWLDRHGVDTIGVRISQVHHTARFVCTTDQANNQIATFYPGAMADARDIELEPLATRLGGVDLVLIGANDPEAMLRHTDECRFRGYRFAADPSQQLTSLSGEDIRRLVDGADLLFTNEYESALIHSKTGWSDREVLQRVRTRVTTMGAQGAIVERAGELPIQVKVPPERTRADPTGVGDAFRSGFLAALAWGLGPQRAAEVGAMLATLVIETVGTQEYDLASASFASRYADFYGQQAAGEVLPHLPAAAR